MKKRTVMISDARPSSQQKLQYMQSMLRELAAMAEAERAATIAYLIEMAYVEVSDVLRGTRPIREVGETPTTIRAA